ncbi:MAG: phenylalanine--tRNA ligase subunit alpha [Alphaproteobacteria bacterium]|nr:MAG: phenylalanine--tRNA ligase subunit alpha [Alphaproteobacteria bacterium]
MSGPTIEELEALKVQLTAEIDGAADGAALEGVRVAALGKKGSVSGLMKSLGGMDPEVRKEMGPRLNGLKNEIAALIEAKGAALENAELDARLAEERVDVTLPVTPEAQGSIHPVSQVIEEMTAIFADMGFSIAEGPDIEDDFHNFTALNFPPAHPARDMHDTFFLTQDGAAQASGVGAGNEPPKVLRTHTSPVQIRHMMTHKPPIRIIVPGRTFRCDSDQTHTPMFHQIEGLVIDTETHMGHLKGCLVEFIKAYFEVDDLNYRFRPHYFPFTEPSAEMDIGYSVEEGNISIGTGEKFMEILGCGMVHPNVLKNCGLDPDTYQGFAFGLGVDRMAMLKYGIPDLRPFFEADMRWLKHYGFRPLDLPTLVGGIAR